MKHPKTTPPRPYTPKKKTLPSDGGFLIPNTIMEDYQKAITEMYNEIAKKLIMDTPRGSGKTAAGAFTGLRAILGPTTSSTAIKHTWNTPYGTPMRAIAGATAGSGMAMGDGQVYCFTHDAIEPRDQWEVDTE